MQQTSNSRTYDTGAYEPTEGQGCFPDLASQPEVAENMTTSDQMTKEQCISTCAGYDYAALSVSEEKSQNFCLFSI